MVRRVIWWRLRELVMWINDKLYQQIISSVPIVCVDVAIKYRKDGGIYFTDYLLLVKRAQEPCKDQWWLPGGRLFKSEGLEECAIRKAREEVGLECNYCNMIYYASTDFGKIHSVNFVFEVWTEDNEVKLDDTCLGYKWLDNSSSFSEYHPYVQEVIMRAF